MCTKIRGIIMGTTEQQLYEAQLKSYNAAVEKNKSLDASIVNLQTKNKEIQEKINRLESVKKTVEAQDDGVNIHIEQLSKGPDTEQFHGKLENEYWMEKKTVLKTELTFYIQGIESIVNQLKSKIAQLEDEMAENSLKMNTYRNMKTSPVLPTKPKN